MLILVPAALLLVTAAAIIILHRTSPRFNATWLIAVLGSFISWLIILFLRLRLPTSIVYLPWDKSKLFLASPSLIIDYSSWPYAFAISTLILAIVLSSPVNLKSRTEITNLAGNLAITAMSYFAVLASNLISLLLGWAAIDIIEIMVLLRNNPEDQANQRIIIGFVSRMAGLMLIFWAIVLGSRLGGYHTDFTNLPPAVGLPVLIGIGLRLGIFPLHLTYTQEAGTRRSQGNLFRFIPPASALVLLSRVPQETLSFGFIGFIRILTFLAALYGIIRWLTEKRELDLRPYWVIVLSSFAVLSTLNGQPIAAVSWGVSMILIGGSLFIHDAKTPFIFGILIIELMLFSGVPFSSNASGLAGLMGSTNMPDELLSLTLFAFLLAGLFRRMINKPALASGQERIIYLTYPFSLTLMMLAYLIIGIFGWKGSRTIGAWPAVITAAILGFLTLIIYRIKASWFSKVWNSILLFLKQFSFLRLGVTKIFRFTWIYDIFGWIFKIVGRLVDWFTYLLEGTSGVLWGVVILVLLIMLLGSRG